MVVQARGLNAGNNAISFWNRSLAAVQLNKKSTGERPLA